jgi:hypothetical protein
MTTNRALALALASAIAIAVAPAANADDARVMVEMNYCQFEDGNPDGRPCLWVDPDTGRGYVNAGR